MLKELAQSTDYSSKSWDTII